MLHDFEIEKQVLACLIQDPKSFSLISDHIDAKDFFSKSTNLHTSIFRLIKQAHDANETIDETILCQRINGLGLTFEDRLNPSDYIEALGLRKVSNDSLLSSARELKKLSIRRQLVNVSQDIAKKVQSLPPDMPYSQIIAEVDAIYNKQINLFEVGDDAPVNIYDEMADLIEERGNNPITEFGMMGPHKMLNAMYGSLLRPGNITVVVARSAVGKTTWCMDYSTKVAAEYGVTVLHFDNGEMSKEELIMRQCAALSGVPLHLLETGKWRKAGQEVVDRVREVWPKVKDMQFYYYNVGGMPVDEMINVLKRFYYNVVGRGNKMIFSFDYIKTTVDYGHGNKSEWQVVGELVDKFKRTIQKDILEDGEPVIPMITSVQSNRSGITTNRSSDNIIDDESIVSLSDRIIQFCSHMFILRKKTMDEIIEEGQQFGTHKMIEVKSRHLGEDIAGAKDPIKDGDRLRKNFINFDFSNFSITEKGDLRSMLSAKELPPEFIANDDDDNVPTF